jgi:DNA-binding MarR family transcriptional regulator
MKSLPSPVKSNSESSRDRLADMNDGHLSAIDDLTVRERPEAETDTDSRVLPDKVDAILQQWKREYPEVDASPMGVVGRIWRLSAYLERAVQDMLEGYGSSLPEFDVLATLFRSGPPYSLTAGSLMTSAMVTSGAITRRVDRLIAGGLVTRERNKDNGQIKQITLTDSGLHLIKELLPLHVVNEQMLLEVLSESERAQLVSTLRKLLSSFEDKK